MLKNYVTTNLFVYKVTFWVKQINARGGARGGERNSHSCRLLFASQTDLDFKSFTCLRKTRHQHRVNTGSFRPLPDFVCHHTYIKCYFGDFRGRFDGLTGAVSTLFPTTLLCMRKVKAQPYHQMLKPEKSEYRDSAPCNFIIFIISWIAHR